jgi:hypothetical protein
MNDFTHGDMEIIDRVGVSNAYVIRWGRVSVSASAKLIR